MSQKPLERWAEKVCPHLSRENPPTITRMSEVFSETRLDFLAAVMQAAVEKVYAPCLEQEWAECPVCGKPLHRKRMDSRQVSTLHGTFSLSRPYFYCIACRHGFHPADQAMGLAPDTRQLDIQERLTKTAARLPFAEGAEHFEDLTGVSVGNHCCHETLEAVGKFATLELVIPEPEEIARRIVQARGDSAEPPVMVVTVDGAMMPTRPKAPRKGKRGKGRYQEVKGFRIYVLDQDDRVFDVAHWHQIQDAEQFGKALAFVADRIEQESVRVALLGDGAAWLWNVMGECFPKGRKILDFYHGAEHVHAVAKALFGEGAEQAASWAEKVLVRLGMGHTGFVLAQLKRLKPQHADTAEEIRKLAGYLENHRDKIHYFEDLEGGYPIGSGGIESANKYICHKRMKLSGAWWVQESGNTMLRVRCAVYNGTFDRVFAAYAKNRLKPIDK